MTCILKWIFLVFKSEFFYQYFLKWFYTQTHRSKVLYCTKFHFDCEQVRDKLGEGSVVSWDDRISEQGLDGTMNLILEAYYDNPKSSLDLIPIIFQRMTHTVIPFRSNHEQIPNRNSHKSPIYGLKGEKDFLRRQIYIATMFSLFLKKSFFLNKKEFFYWGH